MVANDRIVPLDKGEEYLMLLRKDFYPEDNQDTYYAITICPLNTEKYKDVFEGKCGFVFHAEDFTVSKDFWNTFMEE